MPPLATQDANYALASLGRSRHRIHRTSWPSSQIGATKVGFGAGECGWGIDAIGSLGVRWRLHRRTKRGSGQCSEAGLWL